MLINPDDLNSDTKFKNSRLITFDDEKTKVF